jgi:preprotein translocase subunit SecG
MYTLIAIVIIIASILLTLIVLIQNPKGGGIASNFVAPNQIMGVKRSTDVVEKATWVLAGVLVGLSLLSNFFRPVSDADAEGTSTKSELLENFDGSEAPAALPAAPEQGAAQQPTPSEEPAPAQEAVPNPESQPAN